MGCPFAFAPSYSRFALTAWPTSLYMTVAVPDDRPDRSY